jgi:hypothetical protein
MQQQQRRRRPQKPAARSAGQQAAAAKGVHPESGCFGEQAKFSLRADWEYDSALLRSLC